MTENAKNGKFSKIPKMPKWAKNEKPGKSPKRQKWRKPKICVLGKNGDSEKNEDSAKSAIRINSGKITERVNPEKRRILHFCRFACSWPFAEFWLIGLSSPCWIWLRISDGGGEHFRQFLNNRLITISNEWLNGWWSIDCGLCDSRKWVDHPAGVRSDRMRITAMNGNAEISCLPCSVVRLRDGRWIWWRQLHHPVIIFIPHVLVVFIRSVYTWADEKREVDRQHKRNIICGIDPDTECCTNGCDDWNVVVAIHGYPPVSTWLYFSIYKAERVPRKNLKIFFEWCRSYADRNLCWNKSNADHI